jgi:hypothetical protein
MGALASDYASFFMSFYIAIPLSATATNSFTYFAFQDFALKQTAPNTIQVVCNGITVVDTQPAVTLSDGFFISMVSNQLSN